MHFNHLTQQDEFNRSEVVYPGFGRRNKTTRSPECLAVKFWVRALSTANIVLKFLESTKDPPLFRCLWSALSTCKIVKLQVTRSVFATPAIEKPESCFIVVYGYFLLLFVLCIFFHSRKLLWFLVEDIMVILTLGFF